MSKIPKIENPKDEREVQFNDSQGTLVTFVNRWFDDNFIHFKYDELCLEAVHHFFEAYDKYYENINELPDEDKASFNSYLYKCLWTYTYKLRKRSTRMIEFLSPYDNRSDDERDTAQQIPKKDTSLANIDFSSMLETLYPILSETERIFLDKMRDGIPLQGYKKERQKELLDNIVQKYNSVI